MKITCLHTRNAYNLVADEYYRLFNHELADKPYDLDVLNKFCSLFAPGDTICNVGCGPTDDITDILESKSLRMTGVDISDKCIEIARANRPDVHFVREDFLKTALPKHSFDGIIACHVLMYTPKKYLKTFSDNFRRILKPGGKLLVVAKEGTGESVAENLLGYDVEIFESRITQDEIEFLFVSTGFNIRFLETRAPYSSEIQIKRIYCIAEALS